ncbi:MAG: hypothetical protein PHI12_07640 [Dehalococcoidales bacterium]|nr:hypothetical protein [Dehalococcoidales bacterium]
MKIPTWFWIMAGIIVCLTFGFTVAFVEGLWNQHREEKRQARENHGRPTG